MSDNDTNLPHFNLFDSPWIPVLDQAGRQQHVGLHDALTQAHMYRWLDADTPPMTAALHRLLLAVALRVYGPADTDAWRELWESDALPTRPLDEYRSRYAARFDLFDQDRPFLQCPGLPRKKLGSTAQLVAGMAAGSSTTLFDHTTSCERPELSPAAAARSLVTLQAYDTGGLKTPATSDKSSQRGPANYVALALAEGATLKDTLLFNMPPHALAPEDCPPWEQDHAPDPEPVKGRQPRGWVDLLTWPSRRVLLNPAWRDQALVVDRVVITPGDQLPRDIDITTTEKMAGRRRKIDANGKPLTATEPILLDSAYPGWRQAADLLTPPGRPATLSHIGNHASTSTRCTLRAFGQRLNHHGGAIEDWDEIPLPAPVSLLQLPDKHWALQLLTTALWLADQVATDLTRSEENRAPRSGATNHKTGNSAAALRFWSALDRDFRSLVEQLGAVLDDGRPDRDARAQAGVVLTGWRAAVLKHSESSAPPMPGPAHGRDIMALANKDSQADERQRRKLAQYDAVIDEVTDIDAPTASLDG